MSKRTETNKADHYRGRKTGKDFQAPTERGGCSLPVLSFLWGRPWDNMAENFLASLRPSQIRICGPGDELAANGQPWRVTVFLEGDDRTIDRIEQEVDVGLTGCDFGHDLAVYANQYHSQWRSTDPRYSVNKRADIVILRPGSFGTGTAHVDTKEGWWIFTDFEDHRSIEEWDQDWLWTWAPLRGK